MAAPGFTQTSNPNPGSYAQLLVADTAYTPTRALYVKTGGSLVVFMAGDGDEVDLGTVTAEAVIPICITKVKTGSTAAVIGLW